MVNLLFLFSLISLSFGTAFAEPLPQVTNIPSGCKKIVNHSLKEAGMGEFDRPGMCTKKGSWDGTPSHDLEMTDFQIGQSDVFVSHNLKMGTWEVKTCHKVAGLYTSICSWVELNGTCKITSAVVGTPNTENDVTYSTVKGYECLGKLDKLSQSQKKLCFAFEKLDSFEANQDPQQNKKEVPTQ